MALLNGLVTFINSMRNPLPVMPVEYQVRPRLGVRFSLPVHLILFIGFLLISPLLLFVFLVLVSIGVNPLLALTLTLGSLLTSYINVTIVEITYYTPFAPFGDFMKLFPIPIVMQRVDKLFIELNVGGAIIPVAVSIYLILTYLINNTAVMALFIMSLIISSFINWLDSRVIPGIGVALPTALPVLLTLTFTLIATILFRANPLGFSYSLGSLSTLIGADLLNIGRVVRSMRGYVAIGGAGVFDGIYITGLASLVLASLYRVLI
jgi:Predicted membrane protein